MRTCEFNITSKFDITVKTNSSATRAGNIDIWPPYTGIIIADGKHVVTTASIRAIEIKAPGITSSNNIEFATIELSALDDRRPNCCRVNVSRTDVAGHFDRICQTIRLICSGIRGIGSIIGIGSI